MNKFCQNFACIGFFKTIIEAAAGQGTCLEKNPKKYVGLVLLYTKFSLCTHLYKIIFK
jgi:hypothetical protein